LPKLNSKCIIIFIIYRHTIPFIVQTLRKLTATALKGRNIGSQGRQPLGKEFKKLSAPRPNFYLAHSLFGAQLGWV
jgi:hypothetical protein